MSLFNQDVTQADLSRWTNYLETGNRAGFYYEYYLVSGIGSKRVSRGQLT
jgi:hypothetical protein